ncbi:OppA family ABC transporter substrate-binding lipoprotein [Mycoplasma sp. Ms02]|uniref:OppA family ABC transporter substrate-binding lipoprotein n=1 Tax=Mycoplasma sp. Ms02 TaxID=353851 RepID=UPI001C8AD797|nr:hypothetical protein [Mycoplasma sp. Ms02]QZE12307.1 hypothetical protein K4L35_03170 [Mycoplasma sp. Ms02]
MKIKKVSLILALGLGSPFFASAACSYLGDLKEESSYSLLLNEDVNVDLNDDKFYEQSNEVGWALKSNVFDIEHYGKVVFDSLNKFYTSVVQRKISLNLAKAILVEGDNFAQLYDNDKVDLNLNKPDIFSGYQKPFYQALSNDISSINHKNFLNNIRKAKKITITLKDVFYSDSQGNATSESLKAQDFKGLGDVFKNIIFEDDSIIIHKDENENILPLFYGNKYNAQKSGAKDLFISKFIPTEIKFDSLNLKANKNHPWFEQNKDEKIIKDINVKFKPIKLDAETFKQQIFKNFRQGIVSEANFNELSQEQKTKVLNNPQSYGLQIKYGKSSKSNSIVKLNNDLWESGTEELNSEKVKLVYDSLFAIFNPSQIAKRLNYSAFVISNDSKNDDILNLKSPENLWSNSLTLKYDSNVLINLNLVDLNDPNFQKPLQNSIKNELYWSKTLEIKQKLQELLSSLSSPLKIKYPVDWKEKDKYLFEFLNQEFNSISKNLVVDFVEFNDFFISSQNQDRSLYSLNLLSSTNFRLDTNNFEIVDRNKNKPQNELGITIFSDIRYK